MKKQSHLFQPLNWYMELFSFGNQVHQSKIPELEHQDDERQNMKQFLYHDDEKHNQQRHDELQYSYCPIYLLF